MSLEKQRRGEDIISKLPDDVLIHILSRLATEDAVRTCILSSRWKNLWKLIYNLDFYIRCEQQEKYGPYINGLPFINRLSFVNQVLSFLQSKSINSFRIYVSANPSKNSDFNDHMANWAAYAAKHNVRELTFDIDYGYCERIIIPQCVLTSASLVKLNLQYGNFCFDVPESVCFPSLKSLYIYIEIDVHRDVQQLRSLFRGCPVLEDLTMNTVTVYDGNAISFELILPALKALCIHEVRADTIEHGVPNKYVIEARKLEYLNVSATDTFPYFVLRDAVYLNKVSLSAVICNFPVFVSKIKGNQTSELFCGIRFTRSLSLCKDAVRVLCFGFDGYLPMFRNLKNLELGIEGIFGWKLLPHFLTNSPILQGLTLNQDHLGILDHLLPNGLGPNDYTHFNLESVPSCLSSHLKRIEIENVVGEFIELKVIKYLLKHGKVLESFTVQTPNFKEPKKIQKLVLGFFKSSTLCEIKFL